MSYRPLVTFAVFGYNQERFISNAIKGALAQTYSPLQVLLSDDCSSDRTFTIISEMAAAYRGPHEIVLNRNDSNMGIGAHINRLMEIARGRYTVIAAGDDISHPERVEVLRNIFEASGGKAKSVFSAYTAIDDDGRDIPYQETRSYSTARWDPETLSDQDHILSGSTHAWDSEVFRAFGSLKLPLTCEDMVIPFRSSLLGEIRYCNDVLVKHRIHENNVWNYNSLVDVDRDIKFQKFWIKERKNIYLNWLADLERLAASDPSRAGRYKPIASKVGTKLSAIEREICLLDANWSKKLRLILSALPKARSLSQLRHEVGFHLFPNLYRWHLRLKRSSGARKSRP